jgi:hypothetical protein
VDPHPHFNGPAYDPKVDQGRLEKQHERIRDLMLDGAWRTLDEIASSTQDPPASISAQLRHLRKKRFGSFVVERRARGDKANGLYEYRLLKPVEGPEQVAAQKGFKPSRDDVEVSLAFLRVLKKEYEGSKKVFPDELKRVCVWLGRRFKVKPPPTVQS